MSVPPKSDIRHPDSEITIVFMGTATFATPTLERLFESGYKISGVITQPDKPAGRGQALQTSPVKKKAFDLHLPTYQPKSLKDNETHALFEALAPEMIVVVAYGKILPPWLVKFARYGSVNLHGSLLPKYRGAAPVHWAIANGETETGVCSMQMDEGLDTGPVFGCEKTPVHPDESVEQLYARLAAMGAGLMERTVQGIVNGTLQAQPQDVSRATLAPMLKKEHGHIDWTMTARAIHNRVRAFNPWPGTVTKFRGGTCKILKTRVGDPHAASPGSIVASKGSIAAVCGDGVLLEILSIQPENRKPVSGADFANGARIQSGEKFEPLVDN
jgi:methionyl-tRNA formyltransferase